MYIYIYIYVYILYMCYVYLYYHLICFICISIIMIIVFIYEIVLTGVTTALSPRAAKCIESMFVLTVRFSLFALGKIFVTCFVLLGFSVGHQGPPNREGPPNNDSGGTGAEVRACMQQACIHAYIIYCLCIIYVYICK